MGFLRPKSRGKDAEVEQKKRNRLSKPLTSRSTTNLGTSKQPSESWEDTKGQPQVTLVESVATPTSQESRQDVRAHLFGVEGTSTLPRSKTNALQVKTGVAQLVAQYESGPPSASKSQLSFNDQFKKRPMSAALYTTGAYASPAASRLSLHAGVNEYRSSPQTTEFPTEDKAWDQRQDRYLGPTRRSSNFLPGEATRRPSETQYAPLHPPTETANNDAASQGSVLEDGDDDNVSETWTAPVYPSNSRPDTPQSFEHKALGNLSLGSLHITNGRASPSLSEFSIHPRSQVPSSKLRDVSSEYADSEAWEDDAISEDDSEATSLGRKTPTNELQRNFSFAQGAEERFTARTQGGTPESKQPSPPRTPIPKSPETASLLAEEYMAELPPSPFEALAARSSPASTGSVVRYSLQDDDDYFGEQIPDQYDLYPGTVPIQRRTVSDESQPSSAGSKLSSADSHFEQEEAFQSALEFQQFHTPRSPIKSRAPFMVKEFEKSDSGYSSLDSVRSIQAAEERIKPHMLAAVPEQIKSSPGEEDTSRKLGGFLPLRPAIRTRNTAPAATEAIEIKSESSRSLQSAPTIPDANASSPSQSKYDQVDSPRQRRKLQKVRPTSKFVLKAPPPPEEVVVQRNPSVETYNVPSIPAQTAASLDMRVQNLPELEKTVRNHIKSSSSTSTLAVPQDIRFPTPNPEPDENDNRSRKSRDRSKSRTRSKSRRRSMLEFLTGNKEEKRKSNAHQTEPEMNINDLGDVVNSLGTNPYDIAIPTRRSTSWTRNTSGTYDARPRPRGTEFHYSRDIPPHRLSNSSNSQKVMMDDHTASEYARIRSRSIHERDIWNEGAINEYPPNAFRHSSRVPSFNDRGVVAGRHLRSAGPSEEAPPPMPPIPSPAEIRRLSERYDEYQPSQQAHGSEVPYLRRQRSQGAPQAVSSPPPPPPHSPQPEFLNQGDDAEDFEDLALAPPPPSHSPRPMDLEVGPLVMSEDGWADQARAWRARRVSAGETLRRSRASSNAYRGDTYSGYGEDVPTIRGRPRTEYFDGSESWSSSDHTHQEWNTGHSQQPAYHHHVPGGWADDLYYGDEHDHFDYDYEEPGYGCYEDVRETYTSQSMAQADPSHDARDVYYSNPYRREPSPAPSRPLPSRPGSSISHRSTNSAISLAEELHPDISSRPSPAPSFGRYSGGLQYSYEGKNKGFGGSSGTRSTSGKADAHWKGVALKQSYGVDLGDVPIMGVVKAMR